MAPAEEDIYAFYRRDFLSPVLVGLTGRDGMYATFGSVASFFGTMRDRARLQDSLWSYHLQEHFRKDAFSKNFNMLWKDSSYQTPLLFVNTYYVEKGEKGILAPVQLDTISFPTAIFVSDLLSKSTLRLSTAAFLSARFPFISPAGEMDPFHHFLDGGLKENSGAETSREIGQALITLLDKPAFARFRDKVQIEYLSLKNTTDSVQQKPPKNMFQLTAPLLALATNWEGNTRRADGLNELRYRGHYRRMTPSPYNLAGEKIVFPLGWQISDAAMDRLYASLDEKRNPLVIQSIVDLIVIKQDTILVMK